jgi:hypothetical protein
MRQNSESESWLKGEVASFGGETQFYIPHGWGRQCPVLTPNLKPSTCRKRNDSFSYKVSVPETCLQISMLLSHLRICEYLHCGVRVFIAIVQ